MPLGIGPAGLVVALVLDGDRWPDAPTDTGRRLACGRDAARRYTNEAVQLGLVKRIEGWLVPTDAGRAAALNGAWLPRQLTKPGLPGRTPRVLLAGAVLYHELIGWNANRHGVRSDRERAALAGVNRELLPKARSLLAAVGLATFVTVRRGRALLVRGSAVVDKNGNPFGSHSTPLAIATRERVAAAAASRRATAATTERITAPETVRPIQVPKGPSPIQVPSAPPASPPVGDQDGCAEADPSRSAVVRVPTADSHQRRRSAPCAVRDELQTWMPELPAAREDRVERCAASNARAVIELQRLATDPKALLELQRMPVPRAIARVLVAAQVYDKSPRRRDELAVQVGAFLDALQALVLACDVVLGRPRSVGRVMLARLQRALRGHGGLLTKCRSSWPTGRFLAAVGGPSLGVSAAPSVPPLSAQDAPAKCTSSIASFDDLLRERGLGEFAAQPRRVQAGARP